MYCQHNICKELTKIGCNGGVAALLFLEYDHRDGRGYTTKVCMLGYENGGKYKDSYNLCAGRFETEDGGCFLKAIVRELNEEFGINLWENQAEGEDDWTLFDAMFKSSSQIRWIQHYNTAVFVGYLSKGTKRTDQNAIMDGNRSKGKAYKEIDHVGYFRVSDTQRLSSDGKTFKPYAEISSFAASVISKCQFY